MTTLISRASKEETGTGTTAGRVGLAGMIAYAALFTILLPPLLVAWMLRLDAVIELPSVASMPFGLTIAVGGLLTSGAGITALWRQAEGLPMSPYPPARLAVRGIYRVVADPIYVGAAFTCGGVALMLGSGGGLWIVTPVLAASMAAFVLGYEREATEKRLGPRPRPWLSLPIDDIGRPSPTERLSVYVLVLLPWLAAYQAVELFGAPSDAWSTYLRGEQAWAVIPWTEVLYALAYPLVALAPLVARDRRALRRFALDGLVASALIIPFYLLVPLVAEARAVPNGTMWAPMLNWERSGDSAATAFPAFHVIWACIAAAVYAARWPRLRTAMVLLVLAIGVSCVTTGMHATVDVVAGLAAYGVLRQRGWLWRRLCQATEAIANSWREKTLGPVRFLSHGVYAGVGAAAGVAVAAIVAGEEAMWWVVGLTLLAQVGAGIWAQVVEGSSQLLRPYGYFGSVLAVVLAAPLAWLAGQDPWLLLAAMSVGGSLTQAFGRLRCLVQGCCHGRPVEADWGLRFAHPRSRVLRLSGLGHVPLHPTQLYSVLSSLVIGAVLTRMWLVEALLSFIAGAYLVLNGLTRFVEEHYRGEPQTAWIAGLRLYQWLAIAFVVVGSVLTAVGGPTALAPSWPSAWAWPAFLAIGLVTYAAYGVDFPRSNRRFSRLV